MKAIRVLSLKPASPSAVGRVLRGLLLAGLCLLQACAWLRSPAPEAPGVPATEVTCLPEQACVEPERAPRDTRQCQVDIGEYRGFVIDPMEDDAERRFRIYVPALKRGFELRRAQWFVDQNPRTLGMQTPVRVEVAVSRNPEACVSYVNALRLLD